MLDQSPATARAAVLEHVQRILRGVASGTDASRLLHQVLAGALQAGGGRHGMVAGVVEGAVVPLAVTEHPPTVLLEVAEAAIDTARLARRHDQASGTAAVAHPVLVSGRPIGAVAIAGPLDDLDASPLEALADCGAVVLGRRLPAAPVGMVELLDAFTQAAAEVEQRAILDRLLSAAESLFGAQAGFCATADGGATRIVVARGIARERLERASRHRELTALLDAPGMQVDAPGTGAAPLLTDGVEAVVSLPLRASGQHFGHVVLLLADTPDAPRRAMLTGFARQAAILLQAVELRRELRAREEQLATVVQSMPQPVIVADEDGNFVLLNAAAADVFQLSETFEVGRPVGGRLGNTSLEEMLTGARDGQTEVALGNAPLRVWRATVRVAFSAEGRRVGRVLVLQDVTSERELEQVKEDFLAVIGHELRTPLTIVKGAVRTIARRKGDLDPAAVERTLTALDRNVERLERLIEDLLFISAVEQGTSGIHAEDHDVGELIDLLAGERIVVRRPRRDLTAPFDRPKIGQAVYHLVDNALKYSDDMVTIEVIDGDDEIEVAVSDTGQGIYSGDIPRLFERFRQLDGTATRTHGGTGLGLYIARRIVEAHGGRIWCDSRLGIGSRFSLSIPKQRTAPRA